MSNENQMFAPSKKESSVRRKTGLVKPWPSERSHTSSMYSLGVSPSLVSRYYEG